MNCIAGRYDWAGPPKVNFPLSETGIVLNLATVLDSGEYTVVLRVADNQGMAQDSTVLATVCDCTGEEVTCKGRAVAGSELPVILGILGGILLLLSKSDIWCWICFSLFQGL